MTRVLVPGGDTTACLPVIESLAKQGFEVTVASHKRICVGFFSRYPRYRELYPVPKTYPSEFADWLATLVEKNRYDVIMPVGEFVAPLLSKYRSRLPEQTRIPLPDWDTYLKARDKSLTMKHAMEHKIPCPLTSFPSEASIEQIAGQVKYPVLVKPCFGYAAIGITKADSKEELISAYNRVKQVCGECIVQEFVPQTGLQYKAELVVGKNSEVKAGIVYAKLRYYPPTGGSSTLDCTVDRPDILSIAAKMLKVIGWYGVADCDFIEDPRDNQPKLMEINPRFTRSIKIATIAGLDFPSIACRVALGEDIPPAMQYKAGKYLRFLPEDVLWFLTSPQRFKAKPSFFPFIDWNTRGEIMSFMDPGPALAFFIDGVRMMFNRQERNGILRLKSKKF